MTPEEAKLVIDYVGGPTAMSEKLGLINSDGKPSRQRVWNWTKKGIPPAIELTHLDLLHRLKREAVRSVA